MIKYLKKNLVLSNFYAINHPITINNHRLHDGGLRETGRRTEQHLGYLLQTGAQTLVHGNDVAHGGAADTFHLRNLETEYQVHRILQHKMILVCKQSITTANWPAS